MSSNEDYVLVPRSSVKGEIKGVQASSSSVVTPSATASFSPSVTSDVSKKDADSKDTALKPVALAYTAKLRKALTFQPRGKGKGDSAFVTMLSCIVSTNISATAQLFDHFNADITSCGEWSNFAAVFEEYKVREVQVTTDFSTLWIPMNFTTTSTLQSNSKGAAWVQSITAEPFDGATPTFAGEYDRAESKICHVNPARTIVKMSRKPPYCLTYDSSGTAKYTQSYGWQETQFAGQHVWGCIRLCTDTVGPCFTNTTFKRYIRFIVEFRHRK